MSIIQSVTNISKKALILQSVNKNVEIKGRSLWKDALGRLSKNKAAVVSLFILFFISLAVIFAPYLSHYEINYYLVLI